MTCEQCATIRQQTLDEVVDALYRIMPNSDSYETKGFIAELLEEVTRD